MATYTLRLNVDQYVIDSEDAESNAVEYIISEDFSIKKLETYLLNPAQLWVPVEFGSLSSASLLIVKSDESISIKINDGSEITSVEDVFLRGDFTQVDIKNNSGSQAEVNVELYG